MSPEILCIRVSRRALGAAIVKADGLTLSDGRHLPSAPTRAIEAAARYVTRLIRPSVTAVVVDAPRRGVSPTTDAVLDRVTALCADHHLPPLFLNKADVLAAYGVAPLHTRREVRELVLGYWPELAHVRGHVRHHAMDAAAAALYGECQVTLKLPS